MTSLENKLRNILYRFDCPAMMDLGEYHLGLLDLFRYNQMTAHVEGCPCCGNDLIQLRSYMTLPLASEKPALVPREEKRPLLEEVWTFVIDLLSPPAGIEFAPAMQPAMRGESDGMSTRVFHVEPYVISLSAVKETSIWSKQHIMGDIIPTSSEASDLQHWTVYLWRDGNLLATSPLDNDSHFYFDDIPVEDDLHDLILSGPQVEIHLQNLRMS